MRRRLMDLGFVSGSTISVDMRSPLGNPTAYIVRGAAIALRDDQARYILIQSPDSMKTPISSCSHPDSPCIAPEANATATG